MSRKYQDTDVITSKPKGCIKVRYILVAMIFLGFLMEYSLRINLSVALVAMVNMTSTKLDSGNNLTECPENLETFNATHEIYKEDHGQFNWDAEIVGLILGAVFYGYMFAQLPACLFIERFGPKHVFGCGIVFSAVLTFLTPLAASYDFKALIALRALEGLFMGVDAAAIHSIWGNWAPKWERSKLVSCSYSGVNLGMVTALPICGLLIENAGWPSVFYVLGGFTCVWWIGWLFLTSNTPADHPFISNEERQYIEESIELTVKPLKTPWKKILTSRPFLATIHTHFCLNWGFYTLLTCLPLYMKEVLRFDIQQNSLLSALPYIVQWFLAIMASFIADFLREKKYLSTTATRKLMTAFGSLLPALFLVIINYIGCDKYIAVIMIVLSVGTSSFASSGFFIGIMELSPKLSGTLMGISNSIGTISGILGPYIVGVITKEKGTRQEWKIVFFISATIYVLGCASYIIFGSAEVQPWDERDIKTYDDIQILKPKIHKRQKEAHFSKPNTVEFT